MEKQKRWMGSLWIKRTWKNRHFEVSSALLLRNKNDSFLEWIVTCDEKFFDNRWRSAQWLNHPQHFPKFHQKKIMVTIWWFVIGLIHYSWNVLPSNRRNVRKISMFVSSIGQQKWFYPSWYALGMRSSTDPSKIERIGLSYPSNWNSYIL